MLFLLNTRITRELLKNLRFHLDLFVPSTVPYDAVVDHQVVLDVRLGEQPDLFTHSEPRHRHEER